MLDWAELINWTEYSELFIGLLALSTPLAAAPVLLGLTSQMDRIQTNRVTYLTPLAFVMILWLFVFLGPEMLHFFGITLAAFRVAGGILLLVTGMDMMRSNPDPGEGTPKVPTNPIQIAIVPLAVPLTVGPGAITTVIVYSDLHAGFSHLLVVSIVVLLVGAALWGVLRSASWINEVFGDTGILVVNRIMGLIVASIGVEFMLDGVAFHFPELFNFEGHE